MFCKQINITATFASKQSNKIFDIYHSLNFKSKYVIYLLECLICKIQYVVKSQTPFQIRLNNQRKHIKACKDSNSTNHNLNARGKLTIIEQLRKITSSSTEALKERLKQRENFWIKKLKTLTPEGLNQELN